jgi:MinD-like ATPase involved in chromosome partitioning or flagellar assembly
MNVDFLGRIPLEAEMVVSSDDGVPFVSKQWDSKVAESFRLISANWRQLLENKANNEELFFEKFKIKT